jgi:hypothetical protein
VNRNIGRALLAYILSLISPAIAQAQPGDTAKAEADWVIQSERPREVAEAGDRDVRSQPVEKARIGTQGEQDLDAATVWGSKPDSKDGRQSEKASRGTSLEADRVSKSEPIAAGGAISRNSSTGGRKSGGGSSGDKDSGDRDTGDGGAGDGGTGDGGTGDGGTGDGGTGSGGTGERGAGDSSTGGSNDGGRNTGDRDGGSGGSGGGGNSGGRDR